MNIFWETTDLHNIPGMRVLRILTASLEVISLMTDTTDLRETELLLYDTWTEGSLVKVCLRLDTFRIDDFLSF